MPRWRDAEKVMKLPLESAGRERDCCQAGDHGVLRVDRDREFDTCVAPGMQEEVHDAKPISVVVSTNEGESKAVVEETAHGSHDFAGVSL